VLLEWVHGNGTGGLGWIFRIHQSKPRLTQRDLLASALPVVKNVRVRKEFWRTFSYPDIMLGFLQSAIPSFSAAL